MSFSHLTFAPRAKQLLAKHLKYGELVLFLGAGVSIGMGLPNWLTLVNRLRNSVGLPALPATVGTDDLQIGTDEVKGQYKSDQEFIALLRDHLYKDIEYLSSTVLQNSLLSVLGALLMGSRRGNIQRVVTFNFDNMLEWFLSIYGFIPRIIHRLPALEGSEDVRIYHPNGIVPHPSSTFECSRSVVFGFDSVNERVTGTDWPNMVSYLMGSGLCLFIGLSERTFKDRSITPLLMNVKNNIGSSRPIGIWLLLGDLSDSDKKMFLRYNVVPLQFKTGDEIIEFLFGICQEAALTR